MKLLGFVVDKESQQVLFVKKDLPAELHGKFTGIMGAIAQGETPADAMSRETAENVGLYIPPEKYAHKLTVDDTLVFVAEAAIFGAVAKKPGEFVVFLPVKTHWPREPLADHLQWILPTALHGEFSEAPAVKVKP